MLQGSSSTSGAALRFGPSKLRDDAELAPFIAQGVPRGAIKSISDEGFAALAGLKADQGNPASPHYAQLKQELGPRADIARAAFAQGTPHAKPQDANLASLGKTLNEGFRVTPGQVDAYKKNASVLTDGKWGKYADMADEHLKDNVKNYEHTKPSAEQIRRLSDAEQVSLYRYTQEKYGPYNKDVLFKLAPGGSGPTDSAMRRDLDGIALTRTALEKLPKVPPGTTVYRGDQKKFYDAYKPGAVVTRDSFTSTAAASDAKFPGDAHIEIKTKTGRDISGVSLKPGEREVLIPPGASFRVLSRDDTGTPLKLKLEEI